MAHRPPRAGGSERADISEHDKSFQETRFPCSVGSQYDIGTRSEAKFLVLQIAEITNR